MNEIGKLTQLVEGLIKETEAKTDQADTASGMEMRDFALLLSTLLQTKSSISPSPSSSGGGSGLGMDMGSGIMSILSLALSGEGEMDPKMLAALLSSATGSVPGKTSSLPANARISAYSAKSQPLGSASTAEGLNFSGSEAVPYNAWVAVSPKVRSNEGNRSAKLLNEVIAQFQVETNGRYKQNKYGNDTYCNIFLWDVSRAMGAEIPHYINPQTGEPRYYPNVQGAMELDANGVADWLSKNGAKYGWKEVSAKEAQACANRGRPAVTAWKNSGGIGHVQVVCPSKNGDFDANRGVTVAQAGRVNTQYSHISSTFSSGRLSGVKYYVHA